MCNLPVAAPEATDIVGSVKGKFRALVAHPQTEALGELAELLGTTGLAVETARSTVEALNKLRSAPAQVIVAHHVTGSFDGVGMLDGNGPHGHFGMEIMRELAEDLGALAMSSGPVALGGPWSLREWEPRPGYRAPGG